MIRIRRKPASPLVTSQIGQVDYICLTPGSNSRSFLSGPIKIYAQLGDGRESLCLDENHGSKPPYQVGGPLYLSSLQRPILPQGGGSFLSKPGSLPPGAATHNGFDGSDWRARYTGSFVLAPAYSDIWKASKPIEESDHATLGLNPDNMADLGPRAYARLRPKVVKAGMFQTLIESRDVPKTVRTSMKGAADLWLSLTKRRDLMPRYAAEQAKKAWKRAPGKASDQFVNLQFGWMPLVKDTRDMCDLIINFPEYVSRQQSVNGKWVQRKFKEDEVISEEVFQDTTGTSNFCSPAFGSDYVVPNSGRLTVVSQTVTRIWYEGSFRQYYPEFDKSLMAGHPAIEKVAQALRLSGLEVNPVNVYKVLPWTWAVDWFVNVGENLQALQDLATDAVVSRYVYLMRHTFRRVVYRVKWSTFDGQTPSLEFEGRHDVKFRKGAQSPFGFTLLGGGLSAKQVAILGALGISRAS